MLDATVRRMIDPPLNHMGRLIARAGGTADAVTIVGLGLGLLAAVAIAFGATSLGLALIVGSRLADGLDGAVARATQKTDFGGYLDIVCDFAFYGAIPLGFTALDPGANALAGGALLLSFYVNGTSFIGFALLAEKHDMETDAQGQKTLYYSNGLLEGTETIAFFVALCLFPSLFAPLAWLFAVLCVATTVLRVLSARALFGK